MPRSRMKAQAPVTPAVKAPAPPIVGPTPGPDQTPDVGSGTPVLDAAGAQEGAFPDVAGLANHIGGWLSLTDPSEADADVENFLLEAEVKCWAAQGQAETFANASSVLNEDGPSSFDLDVDATRKQVQLLMASGKIMREEAKDRGEEVKEAAVCARLALDQASLTMMQTLSVLAARRTWSKGITEPGSIKPGEKTPKKHFRQDKELNRIFKESGFNKYGAQATTKDDGTKKVADWCGMFVVSHLFRGGGIDEELRGGFLKTNNVEDYFQYKRKSNKKRLPAEIYGDDSWMPLRDYHEQRSALRTWIPRDQIAGQLEGGTLDIRPGDVVLTNSKGGAKPSHITMVESFDSSTGMLATIEGNARGIKSPNAVSEGGEGLDGADVNAPTTKGGHMKKGSTRNDGSVINYRNLGKMGKHDARLTDKQARKDARAETLAEGRDYIKADGTGSKEGSRGAYKEKWGYTVFGIGRPSIVDFEEHQYARKTVPEQLRGLSPDEMKKKDLEKIGLRKDRNVRE